MHDYAHLTKIIVVVRGLTIAKLVSPSNSTSYVQGIHVTVNQSVLRSTSHHQCLLNGNAHLLLVFQPKMNKSTLQYNSDQPATRNLLSSHYPYAWH